MRFGNTRSVTITPVIDLAAHTANDVVVPPTVVNLGGSATGAGILKQIAVADADNEKAALTFFFFKALPTGTWAANGAPQPSDADRLAFIGAVVLAAADYTTVGDDALGCVECSLGLKGDDVNRVWVVAVTSGTPDYTAADDLDITFCILMD